LVILLADRCKVLVCPKYRKIRLVMKPLLLVERATGAMPSQ